MGKIIDRVCRNVKKLRKQAAISQAELAQRANLTQRYVSIVENGSPNVTLDTVERIAKALDQAPEQLLCVEQAPI